MINATVLLLVSLAVCICAPPAHASDDTLAAAMRALEADSFITALELSSTRSHNPWIEVYRLHLRSEAFAGAADSAAAAARAVSALRLVSGGGAEGHPAERELLDLAVLYGGAELALPFLTGKRSSRLDPGTLLLIGKYYLSEGDSASAASYFTLASGRRPGPAAMPLLKELAASGALDSPGISPGTAAAFASSAISSGDSDTARLLIGIVRSNGEYAWLAGILEGDLLAASGHRIKALPRYRYVFDSDICPVEGKRLALQRLAALQYSMKHYRDASASYRTYGLYYPDDQFAETATDFSARIEVASGRWEAAVDTWRRIADTGPVTLIGREAVLGMAVALERLGRKDEACGILVRHLGGVRNRLRPAYLYWIARTCTDEKARSEYVLALDTEPSGSFYARAMREGPGFLNSDSDRAGPTTISLIEEDTRKIPFPGTDVPADHPSLGAFRYFAAADMAGKAEECARGYLSTLGGAVKEGCVGTIYREAREARLESLCLALAVDNAGLFTGRNDYIEFLYPFAYGAEIDMYSRERDLPAELVLAVIREESRFDESVKSPAGAWGLMQIMPSTGEWIGGKLGRKNVTVPDLLDPGFNVEAGCWYLRFLLDRADESFVGALAAYNAGHGRMKSWKNQFSPHEDPLAALELIGPSETRQYVRRVLDSMDAYGAQISIHTR